MACPNLGGNPAGGDAGRALTVGSTVSGWSILARGTSSRMALGSGIKGAVRFRAQGLNGASRAVECFFRETCSNNTGWAGRQGFWRRPEGQALGDGLELLVGLVGGDVVVGGCLMGGLQGGGRS